MGNLSVRETAKTGTPSMATAGASTSATSTKEDEGDLEEEKHDFFFDAAADALKCSVGFCLMTEAVTAMDGFSYQQTSLEEYIAHSTAKGQPLTSPLTNAPMGAMYMPNHNLRTMVNDYMYEREKEWRDYVALRRAAAKIAKRKGGK